MDEKAPEWLQRRLVPMARLLADYRDALIQQGFTRAEANALVVAYQYNLANVLNVRERWATPDSIAAQEEPPVRHLRMYAENIFGVPGPHVDVSSLP